MALVKSSGNMYPWVSHTWNPLGGRCLHECQYCYVHRSPRISKLGKYEGPTRLIEKEFIPLGRGKTIFVCSCTDLFGEWVKEDYIWEVVHHCKAYPFNTYLFQTKNPARFTDLIVKISKKSLISPFPYNTILGITLETNRFYSYISKAPPPEERVAEFSKISDFFDTMVSIEPIMDFDLPKFVEAIKYINPSFVSIGADSKKSNLPEPPARKVKELISALEKFTKVYVKKNLKRLMESKC